MKLKAGIISHRVVDNSVDKIVDKLWITQKTGKIVDMWIAIHKPSTELSTGMRGITMRSETSYPHIHSPYYYYYYLFLVIIIKITIAEKGITH